ncbi:hypothetical protein GALL_185620 [mine drainage metagenome]|uniref:MetA-pathway of phenol degradation n=1 Tax=mine drainage metagenome TaxID=410659 RepID=A0A1J5SGM8_9ZZZZ
MRSLRIFVISTITILVTFNSAWAGPPFITDDPEPLEYQHWEVNYAVSKSWRQDESSVAIPSIDINYGASSNVQFHIQPRYSFESSMTGSHFGIDDTEVGVKYRFLNIQQNNFSFMVGTYPMLQLPTGDTKLGPNRGKVQSFLPLWIQVKTDKWTTYGGMGHRVNPGAGNKNSLFLGVTALYQVTHDLQLGGEVFHESPNTVDGLDSTGFNLGGSYALIHDYNLLFAAGKGLKNVSSTNQLSTYLALQVLY